MSKFHNLSHTMRHCQYHVVWLPKYRFRILKGGVKASPESGIQAICGFAGCEAVEMNLQPDHVHLVVMVLPKLSISKLLWRSKGQRSMGIFQQFRHLKKKPYWRESFLGQRLLCRYGEIGRGHDTQGCPLPTKERTGNGAAANYRLIFMMVAQFRDRALSPTQFIDSALVNLDLCKLQDLRNNVRPSQRHDVNSLHHGFDFPDEPPHHFSGLLFPVLFCDRTNFLDP